MNRICFLADAQSVHTQRWCKYFIEKAVEVHLISFRSADIPGVHFYFIDCGSIKVEGNNKKFLWKIPRIRRLIRKIDPDIVHALYATSYGLTAALCGRHPLVITALGSDVLISPLQSRLFRFMLKYVFRKADHLTAMSDPMKEVMVSLGAKPEKLTTVIFGIDPDVFNSVGRVVPEQTFVMISTRNFETVYNIDILIKALALVKDDIPEMVTHLIGGGTQELEIQSLIQSLDLSENVILHGRKTQEEIAQMLRSSHVFISVSSSDGNNISLNEAMACGCFNVVSDIPANHQWVRDGLNGYFCEAITTEAVAQAIRKSYTHYHDLYAEAAIFNDTLIAEKALWSVNMKKVLYLYEKLLHDEE